MGVFSMENTSVRKVISILLILAVVFSLASCKKVEADYIFEIKNANRSHYYSVSNDTFEKISRVQYNSALEFGNSYSSAPRVPEIVLISAEGNDPAEWEYSDEDKVPLDPEQKQLWIERMRLMNLPFTGSFDVLFYAFDDYAIVFAQQLNHRELEYESKTVVFHNEKLIGTITEIGTLSGLYKHN